MPKIMLFFNIASFLYYYERTRRAESISFYFSYFNIFKFRKRSEVKIIKKLLLEPGYAKFSKFGGHPSPSPNLFVFKRVI